MESRETFGSCGDFSGGVNGTACETLSGELGILLSFPLETSGTPLRERFVSCKLCPCPAAFPDVSSEDRCFKPIDGDCLGGMCFEGAAEACLGDICFGGLLTAL